MVSALLDLPLRWSGMPPTEVEAMKLAADLCRPWIHTTLCELIAAASYREDGGLGQPCALEDVAVLVLTQPHTGSREAPPHHDCRTLRLSSKGQTNLGAYKMPPDDEVLRAGLRSQV